MRLACFLMGMTLAMGPVARAAEGPRVLDKELRHLRVDGPREWTEFGKEADGKRLELKFTARKNDGPWTLRLRQQDVKQLWTVSLNEDSLGRLVRDENDMVVYFDVPTGALENGENVLRVEQTGNIPDDVRIGQIHLDPRPMSVLLNQSTLFVEVVDDESGIHLPSRITIVDQDHALQTIGATSNEYLAVRPGIVYASEGKAQFGLPPGKYRIYAGRGFEYSLDSTDVTLDVGQTTRTMLTIRREVPTDGFVACDTHVHTFTHSGHGDATVEERMITLAAEGIELPIATDHNVHINHDLIAREMNVRRYFTPVVGNEVTTRIGHFNIFPVRGGARVPDFNLNEWESILNDIYRTPDVKVAILNHARDVHTGVRPFGPELFNAVAGENLEGWAMRFNAMEVINSAATQTEPMRLFYDWMALLNRGRQVTPVGSSDSHDVGRHFVGQGRTYIRCDDRDAANIDVNQAVANFVQGRVMVGYGLLAEIQVEGKYGPGELVPVADKSVDVTVRVLGPHWVTASHVVLYANGQPMRQMTIPADSPRDLPSGVKWRERWTLPKFDHDVHLVAIATGPGIEGLYWKTAKPYQATSPDWEPRIIGCSGAVWLDVDGDGRKTSAYDYAQRLFSASAGDLPKLLNDLSAYDQAVAIQAARLYQTSGKSLLAADAQAVLELATESTKAGIRRYLHAWRENQIAGGG